MIRIWFVVPGLLTSLTGGSIYDRRIVEGLRARGWTVDVRELQDTFPHPSPSALDEARRALAVIPSGTTVLIDGLVMGAIPDVVEVERSRLHLVAVVHLPLAADVGLDADTTARLLASERRALAAASRIVVTGSATVDLLRDYDVPRAKITLVEPGTDGAPLARGSGATVRQLLSVATLNPVKGHAILFQALAGVANTQWRLTCAGSLTRHPPTVARLRALLDELDLENRVELVGDLTREALAAFYDRADLFVLGTLRETYGMAVAEALAHGLPVISSRTGAIADLVGDEAGILIPPGDAAQLSIAIARVLDDPALHARLAAGARRVRDRLPTWEQAVDRMVAALVDVPPG